MEKRSAGLESVFVFLIFGIFAVSSIIMLILGARVYKDVFDSTKKTSEVRAGLSYISNKVRAGTRAELIEEGDMQVLSIQNDGEEIPYRVIIYYQNGVIMEDTMIQGMSFDPARGEKVIPVSGFKMEYNGDLMTFTVTGENGATKSLTIGK